MKINSHKVSRWSGIVLSVLLLIWTIVIHNSFFEAEQFGIPLFILEILLCLLTAYISWFDIPFHGKALKIISSLIFLIVPFIMLCSVELLNGNMIWDIPEPGNILFNWLICLLIYGIFFAITGSLRFSLRFVSVFLLCFGIANMYVKDFKGSPLLPWDLGSLTTAGNVAGSFTYEINYQIIIGVTFAVLIWKASRMVMKNQKTKTYRIYRIITASVFALLVFIFYGTDFFAKTFEATPDFFNQTRGYEERGAVAEFLVNTKYMHLSAPDNYNYASVNKDIEDGIETSSPSIVASDLIHDGMDKAEAEETSEPEDVTDPNIIVIMNESFSDLSVLGDFETTEPYMPYIDSLKNSENVIEGNSYVSTFGTGTSNTEYEFLTGNSMAFLPIGSNAYQLYVKDNQPSLVSALKDQEYSADAFHPYYKQNWNRINVYNDMGFDSFTGMYDMTNFERIRLYCSDESDFEHIEQMYEQRDTSKPFFLFNVTMQNHSPYDLDPENLDQSVHLKDMKGTYPLTEQYLSVIKETDTAFKNLIQYFSNVDKPTIILMYGDHQPYVEDEFYEEVLGKNLNSLTDEENQKRYMTRFVMWANYHIPSDWIDKISVNYLSVLLAQMSHTELTPYQQYLNTLYTDVPVITALGCRDWDNHYFTVDDHDNPYADKIAVYQNAAYANLTEKNKPAAFYIKKKDEDG